MGILASAPAPASATGVDTDAGGTSKVVTHFCTASFAHIVVPIPAHRSPNVVFNDELQLHMRLRPVHHMKREEVDEGGEGRIVGTPAGEEVDDGPERLNAFNVNSGRVVRWLIGCNGVLVKQGYRRRCEVAERADRGCTESRKVAGTILRASRVRSA
jgi:hypothetical protein